jgi:hypothetical protein
VQSTLKNECTRFLKENSHIIIDAELSKQWWLGKIKYGHKARVDLEVKV